MKRFFLLVATALLSACTMPAVKDQDAPSQAVEIPEKVKPLELLPAELSVAYFGDMRLEGTGLTLTQLTRNEAYTHYTISYLSNGLTVTGIMNIPHGEGPFPLVILNHGHIDQSVYVNGRGLKREQDYLARHGFAVLHTDYRGHAGSDPSPDKRNIYDAGLEYAMDSANAILAVRAAQVPGVDAEHVGMLGHSLGGGVTQNIMVARPDLVDAFVLYAPVSADAWDNFMRWREKRDEGDRTKEALGTREENPEAWDALSSQTLLDDVEDPVLVFHGTEDESVPKEWSDRLVASLTQRGKEVTYVEYDGEKHEFIPEWEDFMERTAAFFEEHLK